MWLSQTVADTPLLLRAVVGLLGVIVWVRGAAIYDFALRAGAFCGGAIGTVSLATLAAQQLSLPLTGTLIGVLGAVGGAVVMVTAVMAHRTAMLAVGVVLGAVGTVAAATLLVPVIPFWAPLAGAAVGALLFPLLYKQLLKVLTPAVGAVAIAWSAGLPEDPRLLLGLWVLGTLIQVFSIGEQADEDE